MCYANPAALLAEATKEWTPEERQRFEDDFAHFCNYSGCSFAGLMHDWAKWAFFCGRGK